MVSRGRSYVMGLLSWSVSDRESEGVAVAVDIFVPEYLVILSPEAGEKKLQIAGLFEPLIGQRISSCPPHHLAASIRILNHKRRISVGVERISG